MVLRWRCGRVLTNVHMLDTTPRMSVKQQFNCLGGDGECSMTEVKEEGMNQY